MSITLDALTKSTEPVFAHTCSGTDRLLVVMVAFVPMNGQEIVSVKYGGVDMTTYCIQTEDKLSLCKAHLAGPAEGTHDVEVVLTDGATMLCKAASFNGVSQSMPIWKKTDGVGKMVKEIPINTFLKTGGLTLGVGAVNDVEAGNDKLYDNQVLVWDDIDNGLRMDGISALGTADYDSIPLPNKLTKSSYWAVIIIGVNPS
jgi:hypothetical protein